MGPAPSRRSGRSRIAISSVMNRPCWIRFSIVSEYWSTMPRVGQSSPARATRRQSRMKSASGVSRNSSRTRCSWSSTRNIRATCSFLRDAGVHRPYLATLQLHHRVGTGRVALAVGADRPARLGNPDTAPVGLGLRLEPRRLLGQVVQVDLVVPGGVAAPVLG